MTWPWAACLLLTGYLAGRTRPWRDVLAWNERRLALSARSSRRWAAHALLFAAIQPARAIAAARMRPDDPYVIPLYSPADRKG